MNKRPKTRALAVLGATLTLFFASTSFAFAEERITAFSSHIVLNSNGSATVQEEIGYDFGSEQKHGIFREIPLLYVPFGADSQSSIALSSISVTDGKGDLRQATYDKAGNFATIKIGDPDRTVTGEQLYVIRYTVWGAWNTQHLANDEFYWNATGNDWQVPIDRARVEVVLPDGLSRPSISYHCYFGQKGSTDSCPITVVPGNASGTVSELRFEETNLIEGQGITVAVGIPKGTLVFAQPSDEEPKLDVTSQGIVRWWAEPGLLDPSLFLPLIVFIVMFRLWWSRGRDPKGRGTIVPEYDVPDGLSPLECAGLLRTSLHGSDISAAIVDLAERGYIKITRIEKKGIFSDSIDYSFDRLKKEYPELPPEERVVMDGLFTTDSVRISDLAHKLSMLPAEVGRSVYSTLTEKGYYAENPQKERGIYVVAGIVIIFFAFFITRLNLAILLSGIVVLIFGVFMPKKTEKGVYAKEDLLGFKEYLSVAEKDRIEFANAPEKDPSVFEKFLPYAMIFGVEKAWAEQFKDIYEYKNSNDGWYVGGQTFNAVLFANEMQSLSHTTGAAFASAGASGGGGFSGGGAGGGGGGSW